MFLFEEIFKEKRADLPKSLNLRLQRALSWTKQAGEIHDELEAKLLYLWVAFNALHVNEIEADFQQRQQKACQFLSQLDQYDYERKITRTLTSRLEIAIESFLESPYLSYDFWQFQHRQFSENQWLQHRDAEKQHLSTYMREYRDDALLHFIFARLSMLHTQMSLGGLINRSQIFRQYIDHACQILTVLLPIFMILMLEHASLFNDQNEFFPVVQCC